MNTLGGSSISGISWFGGWTYSRIKVLVSTYCEEPQEIIHTQAAEEWGPELVVCWRFRGTFLVDRQEADGVVAIFHLKS